MWLRLFPKTRTVDEEFQFLGDEGHEGSLNDRINYYLGALGYTGSLGDKLKNRDDGLYTESDYVEDGYWGGP